MPHGLNRATPPTATTPPTAATPSTAAAPSTAAKPERPRGGWRRAAARSFFALFAVVVLVDVAPRSWAWVQPIKQAVCPQLNYYGLWQGQWTLFAPSPILNNAWLSAEVYRPDGSQQEVWNSTYWANSNSWERFVGFRQMNYRNRMGAASPEAANDLADYLARQLISPTARPVERAAAEFARTVGDPPHRWRLVLTRSQLNIVLPDDGTLPVRDQTIWISSSKNLAVREYLP